MTIPKNTRPMLHHIRRCKPDETPMFENEGTRGVRLSSQLQNNKRRAIVNRNAEIKRAEGMLNRTQDTELKNELRKRIEKLEAENEQEQKHL